jgi:hypothetical protein
MKELSRVRESNDYNVVKVAGMSLREISKLDKNGIIKFLTPFYAREYSRGSFTDEVKDFKFLNFANPEYAVWQFNFLSLEEDSSIGDEIGNSWYYVYVYRLVLDIITGEFSFIRGDRNGKDGNTEYEFSKEDFSEATLSGSLSVLDFSGAFLFESLLPLVSSGLFSISSIPALLVLGRASLKKSDISLSKCITT